MSNQLYEFTIKVKRGDACDMPKGMNGALVPTYVGASDYQAAVKKGVEAIRAMHYIFDDIEGQIREIPIDRWKDYVEQVWPDFTGRFPTKEQIPSLVKEGAVFFGPFSGFK